MNLLHMKYAVEVSKTESISRAAENLYMGQPNLSRAIKELEESLGITIFDRSSKGIRVTEAGEEFLQYARRILNQVDEVEAMYRDGNQKKQKFSVCTPYAEYISKAFSRLAHELDADRPVEFFYKETTAMHAINNVSNGDYNLGIVRFHEGLEMYYTHFFESKGIAFEHLAGFYPRLIVSNESEFAKKETVTYNDLYNGIEVIHGDPYIPSLPTEDSPRALGAALGDKKIYVFERGSLFSLLNDVPCSFMFGSPVSQQVLDENNLVQRSVEGIRKYNDVLIYRKGYTLTPIDKSFIDHVKAAEEELHGSNE